MSAGALFAVIFTPILLLVGYCSRKKTSNQAMNELPDNNFVALDINTKAEPRIVLYKNQEELKIITNLHSSIDIEDVKQQEAKIDENQKYTVNLKHESAEYQPQQATVLSVVDIIEYREIVSVNSNLKNQLPSPKVSLSDQESFDDMIPSALMKSRPKNTVGSKKSLNSSFHGSLQNLNNQRTTNLSGSHQNLGEKQDSYGSQQNLDVRRTSTLLLNSSTGNLAKSKEYLSKSNENLNSQTKSSALLNKEKGSGSLNLNRSKSSVHNRLTLNKKNGSSLLEAYNKSLENFVPEMPKLKYQVPKQEEPESIDTHRIDQVNQEAESIKKEMQESNEDSRIQSNDENIEKSPSKSSILNNGAYKKNEMMRMSDSLPTELIIAQDSEMKINNAKIKEEDGNEMQSSTPVSKNSQLSKNSSKNASNQEIDKPINESKEKQASTFLSLEKLSKDLGSFNAGLNKSKLKRNFEDEKAQDQGMRESMTNRSQRNSTM